MVYFSKRDKDWVVPQCQFATPPKLNQTFLLQCISPLFTTSIVADNMLYYIAEGYVRVEYDDIDDSDYDDDYEMLVTKLRKYDPESNSWKDLAILGSERSEFALVHLDEFLYAVGGRSCDAPTSGRPLRYWRNKWMSVAPLTCNYGHPNAVVFNGKILMYGVEVDSSGKSLHSYSLEMYDPVNNVWQKLVSEKYLASSFEKPMLTVQDGECYRIVHQKEGTNMMEEGYESDESDGEINVSKITIKERRNGRVTAVMGEQEKQVLECSHTFCMNGKVFVFLSSDNTAIYNTGIDVEDIGEHGLDKKWRELYQLQNVGETECIVTFTFDILKLQPKQ
ncbi:uncharacterized protein [Amphiura filiformis]|uniref:uncharacterized protein n=1 Tax=Amphiura filiformis TaxID=82378 RepID=UPI003B215704